MPPQKKPSPAAIRAPEVLLPGNPVTRPATVQRHQYAQIQNLDQKKLDLKAFPLAQTTPTSGDILTFDGAHWVNQDWVAGPFGIGAAPVSGLFEVRARDARTPFAVLTSDGVQVFRVERSGSFGGASGSLGGTLTVSGATTLLAACSVTETLTVNGITTPATGALFSTQKNGTTKFQINTNGCVGILRAPTSSVYALDIQPSPSIRVAAHYDWQTTSGQMGIIIDKSDKTDNPSHGITWLVGGQPCWDIGQDVLTNNTDGVSGKGSSDMVVCYDYTNHSPNDDGTYGPNLGADILRFTAAQQSFDGRSTTIHLSGMGAGRNSENTFLILQAAGGYNGQRISASTSGQTQHLVLVQRNPKAFDTIINYNSLWMAGCDFGGAGGKDFWFFDNANQRTRLFLQGTSGEIANVGLGTPSPLGYLHVSSSSASSYFGTPQTLFTAGYSNALENRRINLQSISSSGGVENYLFLHGALGSTAAVGAPSITSSFTAGYGLRVDDNHLYLLASPAGTNQTPTAALTIDASGGIVAAGQVEIGGLLTADANATVAGKLGVGTANPQGRIAAGASAASLFYDTPQIYFMGAFADQPTNRSILLETILNASFANNYVMLHGMASGTVASPTLTSAGGASFGLEGTDTSLSLITAAAGTGMTPIRGLTMDNTGALSGTVTDSASGALTYGLTLAHTLVGGAASGQAGCGIGIDFHGLDSSGFSVDYGSIRCITNSPGHSVFSSTFQFHTYFNGADTELLRLRNNQVFIPQDLFHAGTNLGVFNVGPVSRQTVSGSKGGNAALTSLLAALAAYGLIIDSST